jgi:hypothetical protein
MRSLPQGPRWAKQLGLTSVEVAIVGTVAMVAVFGVLEVGRALFVMNALEEATRRAARVAVVYPVGHSAIGEVAVFNAPGQGASSTLIQGLTTDHIAVDYLGASGNVLATNPPCGNGFAGFGQIQFVRVRINEFEHRLLIPLFVQTFTMPAFPTTLPRESLGVSRESVISC